MRRFAIVPALVLLLAGCANGGAATPAPTASPTGASAAAVMVCSTEARADIEEALGVDVSQPPAPTFVDGTYTCRYTYPQGTMTLTVKDLPDAAATDAYVNDARGGLGAVHVLPALGDAAFSDDAGTVVVRKDFKVLRVDTRGLPDRFGQPPHSRSTVAVAVAVAIMLCWTGG